MKLSIDLPQNHKDEVEFTQLLSLLDMVQDLIRNQTFDEPTSWTICLDKGGIEVCSVEPNITPRHTKPHLRLVH